jgi:hypothetical protein
MEVGRTGVLFWDTIVNESLPDCYADMGFRTVSTNPCGEIPLCLTTVAVFWPSIFILM